MEATVARRSDVSIVQPFDLRVRGLVPGFENFCAPDSQIILPNGRNVKRGLQSDLHPSKCACL